MAEGNPTTSDVVGATVDLLIRQGRPGAASFVTLCYELYRDGKYTPEEVSKLASQFVLQEESSQGDNNREWEVLFPLPEAVRNSRFKERGLR